MFKKITFLLVGLLLYKSGASQHILGGSIHGNVQIDGQFYMEDSVIGAPEVPEKFLSNAFANFIYERDNFSAGLRYENYTNPILGFDPRYKGNGIPFRYLNYKNNQLEITAGNFYDQFGSGLVFRTYEERGLGYDNAMDGLRLKYIPVKGVYFKGIIGYQRDFWTKGEGIVRGVDLEWNINESISKMDSVKTKFILGGNFVSKYQDDQDPVFILPENVASGSGRLSIINGNLMLTGEYAYKANDPSAQNNFIYKDGSATLITATYAETGFGISLGAKRIDNMSFRSDRMANLNSLMINYLPALTKNHTNILPAHYPYATQPNGEYGMQAELFFHVKPNSLLGGTYGTDVAMNYSRAQAIDKVPTGDDQGYTSDFFDVGEEVYFEDFNVEVHHKWNKKFRSILSYVYINYNQDVIEGTAGHGHVYSHTVMFETTWKINSKKSLRNELQHLYTEQDKQSWALVLLEYTISPHWFFAAFDQYNYGNEISEQQLHYITGTLGYTFGTNRIQLGYGRQRAGIYCVGGVCRTVPASNGFSFSVTSSF